MSTPSPGQGTGKLAELAGAEVLAQPDHGFPLVRFVVAHPVGALADPPGQGGRLRLCLEMALRGTRRQGRQAFNRRLEQLGASVDTQVGHDSSRLRGVCLADNLPEVFAMAREALLTPADDPDEWVSLVDEATELADLERDDDDTLADIFMRRALYRDSPLARPAGGEATSLAALRLADLAAARAAWGREGLVVGFAGPVELAAACRLAEPLLDGLPARPPPAAPQAPATGGRAALHVVVVDRPERTQVQVRVGQLAADAYHPDTDMLALAVLAFGGTFTSPLTQQVRDERGWSYFAHADYRRRSRHIAPVVLRCAPGIDDAVDCLALNLELFAALAEGALPAQATLDAARQYLLGRYPFEIASAHGRLGLAVVQRLLGLPLDEVPAMPRRWEAMHLSAVPAMLRRVLRPGAVTATLVAPAATLVPRLSARFPAADIEVVAYRAPLAG